jgi:hypothetical protein
VRFLAALLKTTGIGNREVVGIATNDMVENADAENSAGLNEVGRAIAVFSAGAGSPDEWLCMQMIAVLLATMAGLKTSFV